MHAGDLGTLIIAFVIVPTIASGALALFAYLGRRGR